MGKIIVYTRHGGDNQLWRLEDGRLVNKTGMVADIAEASMEEGARVIAWEKQDGLNQKWSLKENCIHSQLTDMVMALKEGGMEPGTEVIMFTKHGGNNQRWFIYPARFIIAFKLGNNIGIYINDMMYNIQYY